MPTEKNLDILVINQVENKDVYQYMNENNLVNANELYFVTDVDEIATETESGLMSSEDKIKLNSIQTGATKTIIDNALSADSTNPVQNKVINTKFTSIQSDINNKVPLSRTVNGKALTTNITLNAADVGALPNTTVIPSIDGLATEIYVNNKFASIVDSAPETLDTLKELSEALGNDPNFATTIATQIGGKVDKVSGKGLSTNDYTTEEKTKLASLDSANYVAKSGDTMSGPLTVGGTTIKLGESADIIGTTKQDTIMTNQLLLQNGAVFGGTALQAGLVTRGICGIFTPDNNGACQKENLYINYDGDSSYRENRQVILQAGSAGTHYGNNLYQYAAARGDAVKGWVQAQGFATTTSLNGKVDKVDGKGLSTNDYTTTEKTKLSGIAEGAEVNQNAFSNVVVGSVTVAADSKTDTLTLVAGDNVTLTPDATNDKITIASKDTVYTHPSYTSKSSGLYKITVDGTGHVSGTAAVVKSDITGLGIPAQDTTYSEATTSTAGLMSATDKAKLNGIDEGAEKNVQSDLSQTDNTATDYVKGVIRQESLPEGYPYKEIGAPILDGTFEFADDDGVYVHDIADENFFIVADEFYAVIWDGKTYQCVATIFSGYAIVLGNLAIADVGADTGEPFLFVYQGGNSKAIITKDTTTTHTVTVCAETIQQIAEEFIPDIGRGMLLKNFNGVMPSIANWSSVTYGNGKFVAVAYLLNQAAYYEDGVAWTAATLPSSAWWMSITYGNGKFVIVSFDNSTRAAYSEDGITWTASTLPSSADWRSVTYGNGKFVSVAQDSTVATYSADGITWTAATLPSSERWSSVTYGNGKFVAVAQNSTTAAYSEDGITWTATTMPSSVTWFSVTYGNGKFVSVAYNSDKAAYSEDGITWTATTMPSSANWQSVTYGNGKFVAVAYNSDKAAYSEDGVNWISTTLPSSANWQSVTYGNGKFVAVINASTIVAYSRNGITWQTELKTITQNGKDVTDDTLIVLDHIHEASKISSGTFAGQVVANASGQTPGTMLLRNSKLVSAEETPTVNGEICWTYE